ncbi:MAG: cytochrome c peroxidase [Isosphaeraceae bacterium]|nr:cytochrome c peroxidase [Isosphaeraceae bacterium]
MTRAYPAALQMALFVTAALIAAPAPAGTAATRSRQPVALAFRRDGSRLYVANARSGTLSVVDPRTSSVVAEHDVGRGLADLAPLAHGPRILAVDRAGDALLLLDVGGSSAHVVARLDVSPDPVRIVIAPDGSACAVASTDSRRLTFIEIKQVDGDVALTTTRALDLPFSPRLMVALGGWTKLVLTDAYGGKTAVVDLETFTTDSVHALPAHNIRGLVLAPDGQTLVLAHQVLRRLARTSFEDVHWGSLLSNHLRVLKVDAVLTARSDADLLRGSRLLDLGNTGNGAGDPAAVAFDHQGGIAVALAGVDEVALGRSPTARLHPVGVGRRPTALAVQPNGSSLYVADTLDDTISIIDLTTGLWRGKIALGPRPDPTLAERGERLFSSARLSHDGWMSCQSCHTDGHTNGLLSDTLGDESYGAPKRVPSLLGVSATGPWAWNGSIERLEDQVRKSVETTMQGKTPSDEQVAALTAYLRSLPPPRPLASLEHNEAASRGRALFEARKCAECHAPPAYTAIGRYDVGLDDAVGNRRFNPPSLLGVGRREPYFHDGRAATLEDVFVKHRHPQDTEWTAEEATDLAGYLRTL